MNLHISRVRGMSFRCGTYEKSLMVEWEQPPADDSPGLELASAPISAVTGVTVDGHTCNLFALMQWALVNACSVELVYTADREHIERASFRSLQG